MLTRHSLVRLLENITAGKLRNSHPCIARVRRSIELAAIAHGAEAVAADFERWCDTPAARISKYLSQTT